MKTKLFSSTSALKWLLILAVACCATSKSGAASALDVVAYQGYVTDANGIAIGTNVVKNYDVTFVLYDAEIGGNQLWSEDQTVTIDRGYFSVLLGEVNGGLRTAIANNQTCYLELTFKKIGVSTDVKILPRLRFVSAPYAVLAQRAAIADAVSGPVAATALTVSGDTTLSGAVTAPSGFNGPGTIPVGGIIMWSGSIASIPTGWALCNGQTLNGVVTPNLSDRFIVGAGNAYPVGNTGGATNVTLTVPQLPTHFHDFHDGYFIDNAAASGLFPINGLEPYYGRYTSPTALDNPLGTYYVLYRTTSTLTTGESKPFDNRPPWYALAYIMRVK